MKYSTAAVALVPLVSAARLGARQATEYKVTDFSAACAPHSTQCSYSFTVMSGDDEFSKGKCSATVSSDGTLPAVSSGTCDNTAYSFTVEKLGGGLVLSVSSALNSRINLTGTYTISKADLETSTSGASSVQSYTGDKSFTMSIEGTSISATTGASTTMAVGAPATGAAETSTTATTLVTAPGTASATSTGAAATSTGSSSKTSGDSSAASSSGTSSGSASASTSSGSSATSTSSSSSATETNAATRPGTFAGLVVAAGLMGLVMGL